MKILVIGGTSFIGPAVVRRLLNDGHDVTLFHRGQHESDDAARVSHIHGDRARIEEHAEAFRRLAPDVVLDMRAMTGRDATLLLAAVSGATSRIVAISSVDVYRAYGRMHGSEPGPPEPTPLHEDSPLRKQLYPYRGERDDPAMDEYDKIPVEQAYLSDTAIAGTVLRLPAVHGERDYQHRLYLELARFDAARPFVLVQEEAADWRWPRAYAANVADGIALAVTDGRAAGRVYNVSEPDALTQLEWVELVGRLAGWTGEIVLARGALLPRHLRLLDGPAQDMDVDSTRIRRELGYRERVTREDGVLRAIAWERKHPPKQADPAWTDFSLDDTVVANDA
ncbi:MAG TPA: NAD-dependent epimerase/dehydratase family protein [Dehalococcoidia bacterium]